MADDYTNARKIEVERRLRKDKVYRDLYKQMSVASKKGDTAETERVADLIKSTYKGDFEEIYLKSITLPFVINSKKGPEINLEKISDEKPAPVENILTRPTSPTYKGMLGNWERI